MQNVILLADMEHFLCHHNSSLDLCLVQGFSFESTLSAQ